MSEVVARRRLTAVACTIAEATAACQALLPPHEARWWRTRAEALQSELDCLALEAGELQARIAELEKHVENQRTQLRHLNGNRGAGRATVVSSRRSNVPAGKRALKPRKVKKSGKKEKPDNSQEAVARRLRDEAGLMSAANVSAAWRRPLGPVRVVRGGLPGLGKGH